MGRRGGEEGESNRLNGLFETIERSGRGSRSLAVHRFDRLGERGREAKSLLDAQISVTFVDEILLAFCGFLRRSLPKFQAFSAIF